MHPATLQKIVQEWFEEHNSVPGPQNSSDLNPTEHLWDVLDKSSPLWPHAPTSQLVGFKGSVANVLGSDTIGYIQ